MKIVPILVGALSAENEAMYGRLLAKYVDDPHNFFSVSSDFCHWGSRYVTLRNILLVLSALLVQYDNFFYVYRLIPSQKHIYCSI